MNIYFKISTIAVFILSTSFAKFDSEEITLEKCWVYANYKNGIYKYNSKQELSSLRAGIEFKSGGIAKLSLNKSFCGLDAPIFVIIDGTWEKVSDSIILIKYEQWGQDFAEKKKILKLTENKLTLKDLEDNQ